MLLERAHAELGWPEPSAIRQPPGAGHRLTTSLADRKLGGALRRLAPNLGVTVGILAADPNSPATEAPLAIVCEFARPVEAAILAEAHRLAWNFCRAPLLITIEPHVLRAWTCCEHPASSREVSMFAGETPSEIPEVRTDLGSGRSLAEQAARSLHWIELATGNFFRQHERRFRRDRCADRLLLGNLRDVREVLTIEQRLDPDICHDLLARLIFIQFLFDRKDSLGNPALTASKLADLHRDHILSRPYTGLGEILEHYEDAYSFFRWLNLKFNGDLFPGTGASEEAREAEWASEKKKVRPEHLKTLSEFVSGTIELGTRQTLLWREYSFDVIPLEFISSIYEEFVSKRAGVVYTPPHLVDFLLDGVLPWNDRKWDLKILDPACGSGIFLVKAYQRLIHRWRRAHRAEPKAADLKRLLENNLFGVDVNPHAVRVASFSLYLAMCDEIDPRHYWSQVKFPTLRGRRLVAKDFFSEEVEGIRSEEDRGTYDLVIGNAPWGSRTLGDANVGGWKSQGWPTTYRSIGPLFLPKAAALCKTSGRVSMLQPAGLFIHDVGTAERFSRKLLETYAIEEIVNLAAIRFGLFAKAVGPACIVTFRPMAPGHEPFLYVCPKQTRTIDDDYRIVIEPHDISRIHPAEAIDGGKVWTALMWGGPRDLALLRRLEGHETLATLEKRKLAVIRQGINRGDRKRMDPETSGRKILASHDFPVGTFRELDASALPDNDDCSVDLRSSSEYDAFSLPQLILKQGWRKNRSRFTAATVRADPDGDGRGILCTKSYISIHVDSGHRDLLDAIWLTFNSLFATYYLSLTSSRFATYRPEVSVKDMKQNVPIVEPSGGTLGAVSKLEQLDLEVRNALGLRPSEWVLIEDLCDYTIPDFKGDSSSPGRQTTRPRNRRARASAAEPILGPYCEFFVRSLKSLFGEEKRLCATIFQETGAALPMRLVAIHLDWPGAEEVRFEPMESDALGDRILDLDRRSTTASPRGPSVFHQRTARIYDTVELLDKRIPTLYLLKPDRCRYWTRSMALRDSDEIAADILVAGGPSDLPAATRRPPS